MNLGEGSPWPVDPMNLINVSESSGFDSPITMKIKVKVKRPSMYYLFETLNWVVTLYILFRWPTFSDTKMSLTELNSWLSLIVNTQICNDRYKRTCTSRTRNTIQNQSAVRQLEVTLHILTLTPEKYLSPSRSRLSMLVTKVLRLNKFTKVQKVARVRKR